MGEERIELEKLNIVLFQSLAVLFSAYIVSLFKDAEYTSQTIAILYLLHFVSFYISNIAYRFYSRGTWMSSFRSRNTMCFSLLGSPLPLLCSMGFSPSLVGGWSTSFFSIPLLSMSWISCSRDTADLFLLVERVGERFFFWQRPVGWKRYLIFCIHPTSIMEN